MPPKKATARPRSRRTIAEPFDTDELTDPRPSSNTKIGTRARGRKSPFDGNQRSPAKSLELRKTRTSRNTAGEELLDVYALEDFLKKRRARKAGTRVLKAPTEHDSIHRVEEYLTQQVQPNFESVLEEIRLDAENLVQTIDRVSNRLTDISEPAAIAAGIVNKIGASTREPLDRIEDMPSRSEASKTTKASKSQKLSEGQKIQRCIKSNVARLPQKTYLKNAYDVDVVSTITNGISSMKDEDSHHWKLDLAKSRRSNEAVFQRTIMMRTINRFNSEIFDEAVDWTTKSLWKNPPPNSKDIEAKLWAPKPDLAIGFQPDMLSPENPDRLDEVPTVFRPHMLPDISDTTSDDEGRAFPFLTLEVKGQTGSISGKEASLQSVNEAAHALFNIWQFMKEEETMCKLFFEKVRVFTAGGHGNKFWFRMHRAENNSIKISEDYPLRFVFHDLIQFEGADYTQHRIQALVQNIIQWSIRNLLPLLQKAVDHACEHSDTISARSIKDPAIAELKKPDSRISSSEQTASASQDSPNTVLGKRSGGQAASDRVDKNARTNTKERHTNSSRRSGAGRGKGGGRL